MAPPVIDTEHLLLRRPELADAEGAAEMLGEPETMRWLGGEAVPREDVPVVIERWLSRWERNGVGYFVVLLEGSVIGRIGLNVWDLGVGDTSSYEAAGERAETELAWGLASRYWGRGYATEAARAVREWAYRERGVTRLVSMIEPANLASARVAERLGAQVEKLVETVYGPMNVWVHPR
jgi:RimJ/RimL family protein N-acetyltransferase